MKDCAWDAKTRGVTLTPDAALAWEVFADVVATQWEVGMDGPTRIPYADLEAGVRMSGREMNPRTFALVRLLERKRLAIWYEERQAAAEAAKRTSGR